MSNPPFVSQVKVAVENILKEEFSSILELIKGHFFQVPFQILLVILADQIMVYSSYDLL